MDTKRADSTFKHQNIRNFPKEELDPLEYLIAIVARGIG